MPLTPEEALPLAELICTIKPRWNTRGVMVSGLRPLEHHPAPLAVIAWAAIRAAQNPDILTPAVIPLNGPHWNLSDRPPTPRLTPDHECPHHPGQWANACTSCAADRIAQPDPPTQLEHDNPWDTGDTLTGQAAFTAGRAKLKGKADPVATPQGEVTR